MFGPMTLFWSYWMRAFLWSFGVLSPQTARVERDNEVAETKATDVAVADRQAAVSPVADLQVVVPPPADIQAADHPLADVRVADNPVETGSSTGRQCPRCAARDLHLLERIRFEQKTADDRRYVHEKWRCLHCGYFEQNIFSM